MDLLERQFATVSTKTTKNTRLNPKKETHPNGVGIFSCGWFCLPRNFLKKEFTLQSIGDFFYKISLEISTRAHTQTDSPVTPWKTALTLRK
jgi:hypothetical protein